LGSFARRLRCTYCDATYPLDPMWEGCPACRREDFVYPLYVEYDEDAQGRAVSKAMFDEPNGVWRFDPLLPVAGNRKITLNEGNTPLVDCPKLAGEVGIGRLLVKDESRNPTWAHKDRTCAVGISHALEWGAGVVTMSSSGNHGISAAAYAARAGIGCVIFVMDTAPLISRSVIQSYGALVVATDMFGRWKLMEEGVRRFGWYPLGSWTRSAYVGTPYALDGYKTIAYELCQQLNWEMPDFVVIPTAGSEVIFSLYRGFSEFMRFGWIDRLPRLVAAEPAAGAPMYWAIERGLDHIPRVNAGPTVAVSIGASVGSYRGMVAIRETNGLDVAVSEEEILHAYRQLSRQEGLFVEPSAAAAIAGALQMGRDGTAGPDSTVVCISSSGGLKDPKTAAEGLAEVPVIEPDFEAFLRAIRDTYRVDL